MIVDYTTKPCTCGHLESSHGRTFGGCRRKGCECRSFLNPDYLIWFSHVIQNDLRLLSLLRKELGRRLKKNRLAKKRRRAAR